MNNRINTGDDGITNDLLKYFVERLEKELLTQQIIDKQQNSRDIKNQPESYRDITLLNSILNFITKVILTKLDYREQ